MDKISYTKLRGAPGTLAGDAVPLPAPFTIYVEPTNICNFKCVYCPELFEDFEQRSGGLTRMDLQGFERVSDQIKAMGGIKTLNFYMMGEPLVNRDLPQFVSIARQKQIADRIILTSNGSLLGEDAARRLIEAGLELTSCAFPSTAETQARMRAKLNPKCRWTACKAMSRNFANCETNCKTRLCQLRQNDRLRVIRWKTRSSWRGSRQSSMRRRSNP